MPHGSGFVAVEPIGDLVAEFPGGYAFSLRYDEKIVPGSVVKDELKKRVAHYEKSNGHKPGHKTIRELKADVVVTLCAKALVRTKVITALYHIEKQLLIVPSTSKRMKGILMGQLVRVVGSVKTTTINVSKARGSLTTRLASYITGADLLAFEGFDLNGRVTLTGVESSNKTMFDLDDLDNATNGISEALNAGNQVAEIALGMLGVNFRLAADFTLKGIKFDEGSIAEQEDTDPVEVFKHEAGEQLHMVTAIVGELCTMFGYKPTVDDGADLT